MWCYRLDVETGTTSCLTFLAADRQQRPSLARPTSPQKTRVGNFCRSASGRFSSRRRKSRAIATGCGGCGYKTASGRGKWPNRDPIGDRGSLVFLLPTPPLMRTGIPSYAETINISADGVGQIDANLYEFVANDALSNVDPNGLWQWGWPPWGKPKPKPPPLKPTQPSLPVCPPGTPPGLGCSLTTKDIVECNDCCTKNFRNAEAKHFFQGPANLAEFEACKNACIDKYLITQ
jgi:hypothetical protein